MRIGTRILRDAPGAIDFGTDLGEDWVVPKGGIRYLVARELAQGAILSGFDGEGRLVGERWSASLTALREILEALAARGIIEPPREIPDTAGTALGYLNQSL